MLVCSLGDAVAEAAGAVARLSREAGRTDRAGAAPPRRREHVAPRLGGAAAGEDVRSMRESRTWAPGSAASPGSGASATSPLSRFQKSLHAVAHNGQRGEVLRQLLTDWTGIPFEADEALQRWGEIERLVDRSAGASRASARPADRAAPPPPQPEGNVEGAAPGVRVGPGRPARQRDHRPADGPLQPAISRRPPLARDLAGRARGEHRLGRPDGPRRGSRRSTTASAIPSATACSCGRRA